MLPLWIYMGVTMALPWTWYLMVPVYIWSIGFILVVRMRQKRKPSEPCEPLLKGVNESLALVERQIWLHAMSFGGSNCRLRLQCWRSLPMLPGWNLETGGKLSAHSRPMLLVVVVYGSSYVLNQRVLRTQYEPRRQELLTLLASLRDETTSEVSGEYPILLSAKRVELSRTFVISLYFVVLVLILIAGVLFAAYVIASRDDHPERDPPLPQCDGSNPNRKSETATIGDEWFKLVSLDDLPAEQIVAFRAP